MIIGVLTQSQQASTKTAQESFLEEANMVLADILTEELVKGVNQTNSERMKLLQKKMSDKIKVVPTREVDYDIVDVRLGENSVLGVDKKVEIVTTDTKPKELEVEINLYDEDYYGIIQGGYYELNLINSKIEIVGEIQILEDMADENEPLQLKALFEADNGSVAELTIGEINQITKKIPILGKEEKSGTGILKIIYGKKEVEVNIQISDPAYPFKTIGAAIGNPQVNYGKRILLNDGNNIPVGNGSIKDNWKIFFADKDFVYLIYGDYYPVFEDDYTTTNNVQTSINNISFCNPVSNDSFKRSVQPSSNLELLKYLKNNSSYSRLNYDNSTPNDDYKSWNDLLAGLNNCSSILSKKVISIQGSPSITMWVASWNSKNSNNKLNAKTVNGVGYYVGPEGNESNSSVLPGQVYSGSYDNSDLTVDSSIANTGYNDILYFPSHDFNRIASAYWLASPGGENSSRYGKKEYVCTVKYSGEISCWGWTIGSDMKYQCSVRPTIAIPTTDFSIENGAPNIMYTD